MKRILALLVTICILLPAAAGFTEERDPWSPYGDLPETAVTNRLYEFFVFWSRNRLDDMLLLCLPDWREAQENARTGLFGLMRNFTPQVLVMESISGTDKDTARTITARSMMDQHNGKAPEWYRYRMKMMLENGNWYVDPESLVSLEKLPDDFQTEVPVPELTPTSEPVPTPEPEPTYEPVPEYEPDDSLELDPTPCPPEAKMPMPGVAMELSGYRFDKPETVTVTILVTNYEAEDMVRPVTLYDPSGAQIPEFGEPVLAAGQSRRWIGRWNITAEQLMEGKVTFMIRCEVPTGFQDENGETEWIHRTMKFSRKIEYTGKETTVIQPEDASGDEPDPDTLSSFGFIQEDSVNMRDNADYSGGRVIRLKQYAMAEILATVRKDEGYWYKVRYNGWTGYVNGKYLKHMTLWELALFMNSDLYRQGLENNGTGP